MRKSVGVVIPARNDGASLASAVASVVDQTASIDSIVVAVGPSADDTEQVARQLATDNPGVSVVDNPTGGTAAGLNLAIAATHTDVVVRVDARSVLPERYVEHALESLSATGAANVGAIQSPVGHTQTERAIAAAMTSPLGTGGAAYRHGGERREVDTAYLGAFTSQALHQVGGYDEHFIRNQDAELNARLRSAGLSVWLDPRLVVQYRPRPNLASLAKQYWGYGRWRRETVRHHPESLKLRQMAAPTLVVGLVACLVLAPLVSLVFLAPVAVYLLLVLIAAMVSGDGSLIERLKMALALVTMHVSWGAGFLVSLLRSPSAAT